MALRRFRNEIGFPIHQPQQGVTIEPGEEGEIDMPEWQPCPFGLIEVVAATKARKSEKAVTEPAPVVDVTEPTAAADAATE